MSVDPKISAEAWIDVGGTFTDCLVKLSTGQLRRLKTLSSGQVPLSLADFTPGNFTSSHVKRSPFKQGTCIFPELAKDCHGFWNGAKLQGFSGLGKMLFELPIVGFDIGGRLSIELPDPKVWPQVQRLEICPECEAPVLAVHRLLQVALSQKLPPLTVRLGTTRGTNALLTRTGAKAALLVTDPFEHLLEIGDQTRPDLFALDIVKPAGLAAVTLTIAERLRADGTVLTPLDTTQARQQLRRAKQLGCQSLAISLLHSYRNPQHELELYKLAEQEGFSQISLSSELAPVIQYVARTQTTVLDAYLSPIIRSYLGRLCQQLGGSESVQLSVMTSAGGLVDWQTYCGKDCILSGPAGGVIALSGLHRALQGGALIGLDMGGTSTDVCRVDRRVELQFESTKAGVRILTPTLPIETVAAGGGSVCWFDGVSLRVGPHSAGAQPGPACYGRGGPLTITDLNVLSGRIPPAQFPFPLDWAAGQLRLDEFLKRIKPVLGGWTGQQLVDGLRRLANEQMADAVRSVSIRQGVDPRDHVLVSFGGAAGQHICEIADSLGVSTIVDHPDAGLLSALGMGLAQPRLDAVIPVYQPLTEIDWPAWQPALTKTCSQLAEQLAHQVGRYPLRLPETISEEKSKSQGTLYGSRIELSVEVRYQGTDSTLTLPWPSDDPRFWAMPNLCESLAEDFERFHRQRFGYNRAGHPLEVVSLRVNVQAASSHALPVASKCTSAQSLHVSEIERGTHSAAEYCCVSRGRLLPGTRVAGPIIVLNTGSTLTVEAHWSAEALSDGTLLLSREPVAATRTRVVPGENSTNRPLDAVLRDCYGQRLSAIATQMGHVLQQTAISVNVKQRRDYSCAVFDGQGCLLANAPHVPVHLGAMGQTVRAVIAAFDDIGPGDAYLCNDPYSGGSHLPDMTMMVPVFGPQEKLPALWVANRAHHADVGGIAPGSMSVLADCLEKEGVILPPFRLSHRGLSDYQRLSQVVKQSAFPPRNWDENVADIGAQQAACIRGVQLLEEYAEAIGWSTLGQYAEHLLDAGELRIQRFIENELPVRVPGIANHPLRFEDALEDGTPICVTIGRLSGGRLKIDFTGTGPASRSNVNANSSIVTAAVLYVLRCLVDDELPLNEGVLRAVDLVLPPSVLNPTPRDPRGASPAVAAGNVETSQRVVDVLLGALGVAAASQGTMNNVLFGDEKSGFYETICGGAGASARASGASAVHTHMTNTRLTDPEILELRYPVRLVEFRIRTGSGGRGRYAGGEGVVRTFEFLAPLTLSLLTSRRKSCPFGLAGGEAGMEGKNWIGEVSGQRTMLPANCQFQVLPGQRLAIETPGGGGFGAPES